MNSVQKEDIKKKCRQKFDLRKLRISLKYRPEIMTKILKMRQCIRQKNLLISNMKLQLKTLMKTEKNKDYVDSFTQTLYEDLSCTQLHVCTQTDDSTTTENEILYNNIAKNIIENGNIDVKEKDLGWDISKDDQTVSIAEQVKEVAQSALQQTGMVYVESAGMYYDYKTGYYYNSELGLYYHTDTGCYYYYSNEKQTFVFHSYPDRSQEVNNAALLAHEKKKARKHKKDWRSEDDIENLMKNLSQEKEDGRKHTTKSKRRKLQKKKKVNEEPSIDKNEMESEKISIDEKNDMVTNVDEAGNASSDQDPDKQVLDGATGKEENLICESAKTVDLNEIDDLEDGECSNTESEYSDVEEEETCDSTSTASDDDLVPRNHPPCMRIIVKDTTLPRLRVGSLFVITKDGGSIGREGDHHCIVLRDENVSRNHLNITYNPSKKIYLAMDLGSKNGTILNGSRMSDSQTVSKSTEIVHGSTLEIGETKLLCHIHPGTDTCGHCEPGLLMMSLEEKKVAYTRTCSVQKQHQLELARLKNKYAPKLLAIESSAYNDRAQARRDTVGSSHPSEKTQSSNLDTPNVLTTASICVDHLNHRNCRFHRFIAPENKGFKLLEKMGWSKGEGLGKDNQGETEPVLFSITEVLKCVLNFLSNNRLSVEMASNRKSTTVRQLEALLEFVAGHRDLAFGRVRSKEARALAEWLA
ncbi:unnamed protein product [Diatraea saccharalis]|uniref:Angiogenic factor with G patch and FHA domains 1 n=1 Tax=Diatraea saccharalis TaxID=40085 RepID=A0A9N9RG84_9NEOP|nr:unnamed protein product [Diatraea saccharalis]